MSERTKRVDELLQQEIGAIISREIADPRIGFVTITDVETTPDLSHAKVWVSVIGSAAERDGTLIALGHAMPFVRHELGKRLRIRRIPELHLRLDDALERGSRVLHLLSELEAGTDPADVPAVEDSLPTPMARLPHEGDALPPAESSLADGGSNVAPPRRRPRRGGNRRNANVTPWIGTRAKPRKRGGRP